MAFLDNSGDIVLDAVLTDLGRERLARGSFSIAKFALGDEEINYSLFNGQHPSGSSHYDLDILKTPVLECFTSDQSIMKSRLLTLSRDNILYMPTFKLNNQYEECSPVAASANFDGFIVMADTTTFNVDSRATTTKPSKGYLHGVAGSRSSNTTHICIDQGIDSTDSGMSISTRMDESLIEDSYLVKLDSRLLKLEAFLGNDNTPRIEPQFLDDDAIATYYIVAGQGAGGAGILGPRSEFSPRERHRITDAAEPSDLANYGQKEMFAGPLGSVLRIVPRVTTRLQQSTSLFDELGSSSTTNISFRGATITQNKFIDTLINVTGVTTGYSIDIPVRILKGTAFSA
jgi:hypothetical protein